VIRLTLLSAFLVAVASQSGSARPILFTDKWKTLDFWNIPASKYKMKGRSVDIVANKSSSVVYKSLKESDWKSTSASWKWSTSKSVPPSDLSKKGKDDRNIALYFIFLDEKTARRIGRTASITKLLRTKNARILTYVFGGNKPRNTFQKNPYLGARGKIIIKRGAAPGSFSEKVDLAADYRRAFRTAPGALVGVALAADSDNSKSVVRANVRGLVVK